MKKTLVGEWYCPNCGDLIQYEDERIIHLVERHNVSQGIIKLSQIPGEWVTEKLSRHASITHFKPKVSNRKPEAKE